jgi:hypothetical protein
MGWMNMENIKRIEKFYLLMSSSNGQKQILGGHLFYIPFIFHQMLDVADIC